MILSAILNKLGLNSLIWNFVSNILWSLVFLQAQMLLLFNICVHQRAFSENTLYLYIPLILFTILGLHTVSCVHLQSPTFL